jgi:EAL domain-containing protein (putative c-di-GMP-specific phosphodiesterase class I)
VGVTAASTVWRRFRANGSLALLFQPLIAMSSGQVIGYEVLSRPRDARGVPIPPDQFFDAVAAEGHAVRADRLIIDRLRQAFPTGLPSAPLFVNVHPDSVLNGILHDLAAAFPPGSVVVEITEKGHGDSAALARHVADYQHRGGLVAVDDFGAGYSGLERLAIMRPDYVKVDMGIVRGSDRDPVKRQLIAATVQVARVLGFQVIGEGMETVAEMRACVGLGVDIAQGYLFAHPQAWDDGMEVAPEAIAVLLDTWTYRRETRRDDGIGADRVLQQWRLMLDFLATRDLSLKETLGVVLAAAQRQLQCHSLTVLQATRAGLCPIVSVGHALREPLAPDASTLAGLAWSRREALVVEDTWSLPGDATGALNRELGRPRSVAIVPVGRPAWGLLGGDYLGEREWDQARVDLLNDFAHLITVLTDRRSGWALPELFGGRDL